MSNNTVSLYIDDTIVRLMITRGKRITRLAELQMEESLGSIDTAEKEAGLAVKLRTLLKINRVSARKIILGISGLHCLTRPVVLPELPKAMLDEAVIREARRVLPMPLEQLYLSWQVVSVSGGKTNIFMVALPRQIADTALRIINRAGCKPYLMDIKPLALARLSPEPTAVILDVQPKEFDIIVMINGIPQPVRSIAFPGESLSLTERFAIVKEDLKRTIEFVKTKAEEEQIKPETTIYVSGELAEHPELYQPLAEELGLKASKLTSPLKYLKYLEPSNYLANIGLALKEMEKVPRAALPDFNTLPAPYLPKHIPMNRLLAVPAVLTGIAVIVLLVITVRQSAINIETAQAQVDSNNFLIEKRQTQKKEMSDKVIALEQRIAGAEAEYDTYTSALKKMTDTGGNMNINLEATVDNIVSGLAVASLSLNDSQISISGTAAGEEEVFKYVRNLTATGRFKEITINGISLNQGTGEGETSCVNYSLSCILLKE